MNIIKAPQKNIEAYLYNDLNIQIYEELIQDEDFERLWEPLEFFNLLYTEFEFFQTNVERYLEIKNHFGAIKLKNQQRLFSLEQSFN